VPGHCIDDPNPVDDAIQAVLDQIQFTQ